MYHCTLIKKRENPFLYSRSVKWVITTILASAALLGDLPALIIFPALPQVARELHTTNSLANLSSTLCFISTGIAPLYWSMCSDKTSRRSTYIISITLFTIFTIGAGFASSIVALVVLRMLSAFCGCAAIILGPSVIADIWESSERGYAMSIYYIGHLLPPAIGPVLGGAITRAWGWRAIQWFLSCYSASILLIVFLFIPDVSSSRRDSSGCASTVVSSNDDQLSLSERTTSEQRNGLQWHVFRAASYLIAVGKGFVLAGLSPLQALRYFRFPIVCWLVYLASTSLAVLVMTLTVIPHTFTRLPYRFDELVTGALCIPMPIGLIIGDLVGGTWSDRIMKRQATKAASMASKPGVTPSCFQEHEKSVEEPENQKINVTMEVTALVVHQPKDRIRENMLVFGFMLPATLLWFGWTLDSGCFWVVPMVPWFLMGFSTGIVFGVVTTTLVELVPHQSVTMVALNTLGKNSLAALGGSITQPLSDTIGLGWMYTMLSALVAGNLLVVLIFMRYGEKWTQKLDEVEGIDRNPVGVASL